MATGRTTIKWLRAYVNGYDLSGVARSVGPLDWSYNTAADAALSNPIKTEIAGVANISAGVLNAFLDTVWNTGFAGWAGGGMLTAMFAQGIRDEPAQGDPVFAGQFTADAYIGNITGDGYTVVTIPLGSVAAGSTMPPYTRPWGVLLHANGAETGANAANGISDYGVGTSTALGGFMVYQMFSSNAAGTATLTVEHCATAGGTFLPVGGLTSGAIGFAAIPSAALVCTTAMTTSINQYVRWQIALAGGMTTCTFALGFFRRLY